MSLRIDRQYDLLIQESATDDDVRYQRKPTNSRIRTDSYARENSGSLLIVPGETQALPFGDVSVVDGFHLRLRFTALTDLAQVNIQTGANGATLLDVRPVRGAEVQGPSGVEYIADLILDLNNITTLEVLVAGGQTNSVRGVFAVWGDAS